MTVAAPTLDELANSDEPAWLWDTGRCRIAWANMQGVRSLGGDTLFDLIDRPFDPAEPGVAELVGLADTLGRGETATAQLFFPSASTAPRLTCRCWPHLLADGRTGVLAVAQPDDASRMAASLKLMTGIVDSMPLAVCASQPDGRIAYRNPAFDDLFGTDGVDALAGVLGSPEEAEALLSRVAAARMTSTTMPLRTRYGPRDLRVTARRLAGEAARRAVLVMVEDVTDRRALERALMAGATPQPPQLAPAPPAGVPPPTLSAEDREALRTISAAIEKEAEPQPQDAPDAAPPTGTGPFAHEASDAAPDGDAEAGQIEVPELVSRMLDGLDQAVVLFRDKVLIFANRAALALLGYDAVADLAARRDLIEALAQTGGDAGHVRVTRGDGSDLLLKVTLGSFPWHDGPIRQATLATAAAEPEPEPPDETPGTAADEPPAAAPVRALDEDAFLTILDTAADGIVTMDTDGRIVSLSAGAEALFGWRLAEVAGQPFEQLLVDKSRKTLRDYLAALSDSGIASVFNDGREVEAKERNGGTIPLFLTLSRYALPSRGDRDARPLVCAVVRDITQWKTTEAELRRAKEAAERSNAQKSEFLANISHELRTPLNAIMGFSEVMRTQRFGELRNPKYLAYANDIHESGEHLLSLINDLLDLSKIEAGKMELSFSSVDLEQVIDEVMKLMQDQATAARVVLRKTLPAGFPHVVADPRSMKQVILNILSNAVKFTDPGGQVIVSGRLDGSGELTLGIKDTGIGMNEEELRKALKPFERAHDDEDGERKRQGTGLGLPLTKALIEANRARFDIASEPGKGTLVEITFPTQRVLAA